MLHPYKHILVIFNGESLSPAIFMFLMVFVSVTQLMLLLCIFSDVVASGQSALLALSFLFSQSEKQYNTLFDLKNYTSLFYFHLCHLSCVVHPAHYACS